MGLIEPFLLYELSSLYSELNLVRDVLVPCLAGTSKSWKARHRQSAGDLASGEGGGQAEFWKCFRDDSGSAGVSRNDCLSTCFPHLTTDPVLSRSLP